MGFCIGGPFIWNLLQRAPERIVAAVLAQPSGFRPEMPDLFYQNNIKGWGPELCARRPDITMAMVDAFLKRMYRTNADFVFTVTRDFVRSCQTPDPGPAGRRPGAPVRRGHGERASRAERGGEPLSVEGHQGPHSPGGAPRAHLPPGASARDSRPLRQAVWRRSTAPPCPPCGRMWRTAARVFSANASVSDGIGNRSIVSLLSPRLRRRRAPSLMGALPLRPQDHACARMLVLYPRGNRGVHREARNCMPASHPPMPCDPPCLVARLAYTLHGRTTAEASLRSARNRREARPQPLTSAQETAHGRDTHVWTLCRDSL